jgi:hypothetical protein
VQQAGAATKTNVAADITTAQTLDGVQKQVEQNKQDLGVAVAANQQEGSDEGKAAAASVKEVLNQQDPVIKDAPVQTPALAQAGAAATAAAGQNNNNNNGANAGGNNNNNNNGGQTQTGNGRQRGGKNGGNANAASGNGNAATGNGNAATGGQGNGRQRGGNNNQNNKRAFGRWVGRQLANLRQ